MTGVGDTSTAISTRSDTFSEREQIIPLRSDQDQSPPAIEILCGLLWTVHGFVNGEISAVLAAILGTDERMLSSLQTFENSSLDRICSEQIEKLFDEISSLHERRLSVDQQIRKLYEAMEPVGVGLDSCVRACPIVNSLIDDINKIISALFHRIEVFEASFCEENQGMTKLASLDSQVQKHIRLSEAAIETLEQARLILNDDAQLLLANVMESCERIAQSQDEELRAEEHNLETLSAMLSRTTLRDT